jgi:hypothetical protein
MVHLPRFVDGPGWHCRFSIADCRLTTAEVGAPLFQSTIGNRQSAIDNRQYPIGPQKNLILSAMNTLKTTMA